MPRPREFDEEKVLDIAVDVFRRKGFENTSVADLEAASGVGRQSIYNVFGDKQSLFLRALQRYGAAGQAHLDTTVGDPSRGLEGVRAYLHGLAAFLTEGEDTGGCLVTRATATTARYDAAVEGTCRTLKARQVGALESALEVASRRGELRSGIDPAAGARALGAGAYGMGVMAAGGASRRELKEVADILIAGLAAPESSAT